MKTNKITGRIKMVCHSPSGTVHTVMIHKTLAWAAARGIAKDTHNSVTLYGVYGTAEFGYNGSGKVTWNDKSELPGEVTKFDENVLVCIN